MGDDASDSVVCDATGNEKIPASPIHGGLFIEYNIFGNIFEVTCNYKPPLLPIGKGALWHRLVISILSYPILFFSSIPIYFFFFFLFSDFGIFILYSIIQFGFEFGYQ